MTTILGICILALVRSQLYRRHLFKRLDEVKTYVDDVGVMAQKAKELTEALPYATTLAEKSSIAKRVAFIGFASVNATMEVACVNSDLQRNHFTKMFDLTKWRYRSFYGKMTDIKLVTKQIMELK